MECIGSHREILCCISKLYNRVREAVVPISAPSLGSGWLTLTRSSRSSPPTPCSKSIVADTCSSLRALLRLLQTTERLDSDFVRRHGTTVSRISKTAANVAVERYEAYSSINTTICAARQARFRDSVATGNLWHERYRSVQPSLGRPGLAS